jgi:hypothetical protein
MHAENAEFAEYCPIKFLSDPLCTLRASLLLNKQAPVLTEGLQHFSWEFVAIN